MAHLPNDDPFEGLPGADLLDDGEALETPHPPRLPSTLRDHANEADWWEQQLPVYDTDEYDTDEDASPSGLLPLVEVVWRLHDEFNDRHGLNDIIEVVQRCRHDLDRVSTGSAPELERMARARLDDLA